MAVPVAGVFAVFSFIVQVRPVVANNEDLNSLQNRGVLWDENASRTQENGIGSSHHPPPRRTRKVAPGQRAALCPAPRVRNSYVVRSTLVPRSHAAHLLEMSARTAHAVPYISVCWARSRYAIGRRDFSRTCACAAYTAFIQCVQRPPLPLPDPAPDGPKDGRAARSLVTALVIVSRVSQ